MNVSRSTSHNTTPSIPHHIHFSPEFHLLATCSWLAPPNQEHLQAQNIATCIEADIDWGQFIALTDRHRVQTIAYTALSRHAGEKVPDPILRHLKDRSTQFRMQALMNAAEHVRLCSLFDANGIRVIPWKGVMLSQRLFGDPAIRHARDLDILIQPDDLDLACRILETAGYKCLTGRITLTPKQRRSVIQHFHHFEFVNGSGLHVELHWSFYAWPADQVVEVWRQSTVAELAGVPINCMEDDLLLLTLCDHGAKHTWFRLKWLSDVAMLLTEDRPNGCRALFDLADRLDLKRTLAHTALMVHWIYGVPLADELMLLVSEEKKSGELSLPALNSLQWSTEEIMSGGERAEGLRAALRIWKRRPSLSWRTALMPILTSTADYQDLHLPDRLFWLYIPLRPFLWLRRHYLTVTKQPA